MVTMSGRVRLCALLLGPLVLACGGVEQATNGGEDASSSTATGNASTAGDSTTTAAAETTAGTADGDSGTTAPVADSTGVATGSATDSGGSGTGDGPTGSTGESDCAPEGDIRACFSLRDCTWNFDESACEPIGDGDPGDNCQRIPVSFCRLNPACTIEEGECTDN
jgi:hypothetical protein